MRWDAESEPIILLDRKDNPDYVKEKKYAMNNIEIIKDLKKRLVQRFGDNIKDVILFGSQLQDDRPGSDYDILILFKEKTSWEAEREISDICYEIDLEYGIITDTHVLSDDELNSPRGRQPVYINAMSNGLHT